MADVAVDSPGHQVDGVLEGEVFRRLGPLLPAAGRPQHVQRLEDVEDGRRQQQPGEELVRGVAVDEPVGVVEQDQEKNPLESEEPIEAVAARIVQRLPGDSQKDQGKPRQQHSVQQ